MSAFALVLRLVLSMAVVLGLMWVAGRILRNRSGMTGKATGGRQAIEVLARRGLSKTASVAVVRAGGRTLVLGVTDATITLLGDADADAIDELTGTADEPSRPPATNYAGPSWRGVVETLRERTVRRP
jgi:flagellar protein FliO/FliZ